MRILVTGASGFVGRALCTYLIARGHLVRAAVRHADSILSTDSLDVLAVGEIGAETDWLPALKGVDCVIHCAGRAHVMHETETEALAAYRVVNVAGTERLAKQAAGLGVRRLIFLSSIKVNGESTDGLEQPFGACNDDGSPSRFSSRDDEVNPEDPYGISKCEAEQVLWEVSVQTALEVVVVRSPLVYGPAVKGNMLRLLQWVSSGLPLPLGAVHNKRSLIGLTNLVDLLLCCAQNPAATGHTFLASDGHDLSTPQLIRLIAECMNRSSLLLLPVPTMLLRAGGLLLGKRGELDRLLGTLQVDSEHVKARLGWTPPVSVADGVREMTKWYESLRVLRAR